MPNRYSTFGVVLPLNLLTPLWALFVATSHQFDRFFYRVCLASTSIYQDLHRFKRQLWNCCFLIMHHNYRAYFTIHQGQSNKFYNLRLKFDGKCFFDIETASRFNHFSNVSLIHFGWQFFQKGGMSLIMNELFVSAKSVPSLLRSSLRVSMVEVAQLV